jgi:hypothetical protein
MNFLTALGVTALVVAVMGWPFLVVFPRKPWRLASWQDNW